jgi:hypothetical protein
MMGINSNIQPQSPLTRAESNIKQRFFACGDKSFENKIKVKKASQDLLHPISRCMKLPQIQRCQVRSLGPSSGLSYAILELIQSQLDSHQACFLS